MSGGSFDYAYLKLEEFTYHKEIVDQAVAIIAKLMHDVEWCVSGDDVWDTEMAAKWYQLVYNLCAKLSNQYILEEPQAPQPPTHYPSGEAHCQYCGAEEEHWNNALRLIYEKRNSS